MDGLLKERVFSRAADLEAAAIGAANAGALILCATARLARRLLHGVRLARLAEEAGGWATPSVRAFRGWVSQSYAELWPAGRPLTPVLSMRLWHEAVAGAPAPEGLRVQPALYTQLQASLDALLEAGLAPAGTGNDPPLAGFRRAATARFLNLANRAGIALWRDTLVSVAQAVADGRSPVPGRVILAGFDDLSPLERMLGEALASRSDLCIWRAAAGPGPVPSVRLFAAPEQECRAVCAEVLEAWNEGVRRLGLVFADPAWFPLLKHCLDELTGWDRPDFEREIRYNLTVGTPLVEHPLFQAAVIPLRAATMPAPAPLLASLFESPYVRPAEPGATDRLRAALWESERPLSFSGALDALAARGYPVDAFRRLAKRSAAPLGDWLADQRAALAALGFGRYDGMHRAVDAIAGQRLDDLQAALAAEAGAVCMGSADALAWLTAAAGHAVIAEKTPETEGIQVLKPAEARGLAFDRLWVVGTHGMALPAPSREWPFLDPHEQQALSDGTVERQWDLGVRQVAALLAAAPRVTFSRAAAGGEETPFIPCPLLPDAEDAAGRPVQETYRIWNEPTTAWMRARWIGDGWRALAGSGIEPAPPAADSRASPLEPECSVTALQDLAHCPFLFFCRHRLGLEPLRLPEAGLDPRLRGQVLHAIVRRFMAELGRRAPQWPADEDAARVWLTEAVDIELGPRLDDVFWRVERRRLLGQADEPGLLTAWLAAERDWAQAGWRVAGVEAAFEGLAVSGLTLRGRIDRIDEHPRQGLVVWDYKSGAAPAASAVIEQATELQLPAYLLALQRGRVPGLEPGARPVQAGYIRLKRADEVAVAPLAERKQPVDWAAKLPAWEQSLAERVGPARHGRFEADPRPGSPRVFHARTGICEYCEYHALCGFFDGAADDAE